MIEGKRVMRTAPAGISADSVDEGSPLGGLGASLVAWAVAFVHEHGLRPLRTS